MKPNGRDGKGGTGRSPKARRRGAPARCTVPAFRFVSTHCGETQRSWESLSMALCKISVSLRCRARAQHPRQFEPMDSKYPRRGQQSKLRT
ncbi:MAG: hypothetical protein K8H84_14195 [Sulfuricella denitrificans]|nr:hypothetical protein [Sulfuricella denitrificans]